MSDSILKRKLAQMLGKKVTPKIVKEAKNKFSKHLTGTAELMRKNNPKLSVEDSERAAKWKAYGDYMKRKHNSIGRGY